MKDAAAARLDALLVFVHRAARVLPALTAENAAAERARLIDEVARGGAPEARFVYAARRTEPNVREALEAARALAPSSPAAALYLARLDELELELGILDAIGSAERVRPLAAERYGTGAMRTTTRDGREVTIAEVARAMLSAPVTAPEAHTLPAEDARGGRSAAGIVRDVARAAGLEVTVRVEPKLAAGAASGERSVLLAARSFGEREALRIAVHEVLGHLTSAANARSQPLRLLDVGTAGSFGDQEGVALALEEQAGVLDATRARILAARVLATDAMHEGVPFGECAQTLAREHGLSPNDAVAISERAYRGGGVARDASYLHGWLAVRGALERREATLDELRMGRVGVADLAALRALVADGVLRPSRCCPSVDTVLRACQSICP
jgi:hypothetical protein